MGARVCQSDGTYGACVCTGADVVVGDASGSDVPTAMDVADVTEPPDVPTSDTATDVVPDAADASPACVAPRMTCSGVCTDPSTDPANCGSCGFSCGAGMACRMSRCASGSPVYSSYTTTRLTLPFLDACAVPGNTVLTLGVDDQAYSVALPFAVTFYDVNSSSLWVGSNGAAGFGASMNTTWHNCLPDPGAVDEIFPFAADLYVSGPGLCTATFGAAPRRQFVVTWNASVGASGPRNTFSLVLNEGTDVIDMSYNTLGTDGSGGAGEVIGISHSGTAATQFACMMPGSVHNGDTLRFTPVP